MNMTKHARTRCRQRGVTEAMVAMVLNHGDREVHCGGGCTAVEISRRRVSTVADTTDIAPERLSDLVVVLNDQGDIVTVVRTRGKSASRRYRRGLN